ncbi:unnamed protein product [Blepharisma stoltei]|uniref:Calpain catalytic domain-containing protein n=1 Tax=Blepharisma stoltei TaxID=1481888 RepID=A0AAU9J1K1_9CILI|nr:unnamed protein product [Blepharisma stoltei]
MKGKKEVKKPKQAKPLKELLPPGFTKQPREPLPLSIPDSRPATHQYEFQIPSLCPNWPGDDAALNHDFELSSVTLYEDDFEYVFPPSIYEFCPRENVIMKWPEDIVGMNEITSRFSKRFNPKKQATSGMGGSFFSMSISRQQNISEIATDEAEKAMVVVSFIERDETPEEFEARKQKEAEKIALMKKKPPKTEELHIGKVKEVKLGNIEMGKQLPHCSKWISSQLQILKDKGWKDPHTSESLWNKIYPQKEGIPIYNPSGRYWVKLMLLGVPRLVEIDCRVPTNLEGLCLLPRSSTFRDLWPIILTKAYFKLYSFRWRNISKFVSVPDDEIDGSFIYSLTGMLPQKMTINQINQDEWRLIQNWLRDDAWDQGRVLVSVHCSTEKTPSIPSMSYIEEDKDEYRSKDTFTEMVPVPEIEIENIPEKNVSAEESQIRTPTQRNLGGLQVTTTEGRKYSLNQNPNRPVHVLNGFGYLLYEAFSNPEEFDMKKVLRKEKVRIQEEAKTALLRAKATSPARKLKRHQSPARLREYQKRKARREKEKEEKRQKLLEVKLCQVYKFLRIKTAVTNIPVLTVDCGFSPQEIDEAKLRLLNQQFFQDKEVAAFERLMEEEDRELFDPKDSGIEESNQEESIINYDQLVQPPQRAQGGVWISSDDFPFAFTEFIIYHHISFYPHNMILDDLWKDQSVPFTHNQDFDVWIIDAKSDATFLVAFSPLLPNDLKFQPSSISLMIQRYDFENEVNIPWDDEAKLTSTSILANQYNVSEGLYVLKPSIMCAPCGSITWISSTVPVETMSRMKYLSEKQGWSISSLNFDYSAIAKKAFYIPMKVEITSTDPLPVFIKLSSSDPNLLSSAQLLLINRDKDPLEQKYSYLDIATLESQRISFSPNEKGYRLLLLIISSTSLLDGQVSLNILTKTPEQIKATPGDMMDPAEFSDRYLPNKYGIIFKEHFFIPEEVHFSLHLRLRKGGLPIPGSKTKELAPEEPLLASRLIKLSLYEGDTIICSSEGYNQAYFTHINLRNNGREFLLVCKFDITEIPEIMNPSEETQDMNWIMRIISSESIAIAKDTRKEDREEAIRKSWETSQPGRQELAKTSRGRYLAQMKKNNGEALNDQENELLKDSWADRRKQKKEQEVAGKPKPKGKDAKNVKEVEKPQVVEFEIPKAEDHVMHSVQKFLNHAHSDRLKTIKQVNLDRQLFTYEFIEESKVLLKQDIQNFAQIQEQRKALRQQYKQEFDAKKEFYKAQMLKRKEQMDSNLQVYKESRGNYQNRCDKRKEILTKLQTALQANDLATLEQAINDPFALACDPVLLNQCLKVLSKTKK